MNEQSLRTGDSVHEVIRRYSDMVYRLAYARTGSKPDAEDVYQDVFFKLFRTGPEFESEEHLKAWLIRTTTHTSINLLKSAWRRYMRPETEITQARPAASSENNSHGALDEALRQLPEKYRVVLYLHYYEDYSTEEIADILGCKPSTIRSQLKRGREKLKFLIEESEVDKSL